MTPACRHAPGDQCAACDPLRLSRRKFFMFGALLLAQPEVIAPDAPTAILWPSSMGPLPLVRAGDRIRIRCFRDYQPYELRKTPERIWLAHIEMVAH